MIPKTDLKSTTTTQLLATKAASSINHNRKLSFELHSSITSIPKDEWNACLIPEHSSPFLEHSWLASLEDSGCACPDTGWAPQHLSIHMDGKVRGYVPLYIKGHSMGEFIFDNSWAEAAYQSGITYYPKLLVAVPFTPATGQRILLHPQVWEDFSKQEITQIRRSVSSFLIQVAESNQLSSVHFNFLTDNEATDLSGGKLPQSSLLNNDTNFSVQEMLQRMTMSKTNGSSKKNSGVNRKVDTNFMRRTSLQYHWTNANSNNAGQPYASFDEYLGCFKSKRRITIKRERRKVLEEEGIRIDAVVGNDILKVDGLVERMFEIYMSTVDKMLWGRQYLTLEFFQLLVKSDFLQNLAFLCARPQSSGPDLKAEDVFAGTFNIVKNGVFYGRYWGCLREVKNLHFETCYWSAIDFCIQNGIKRMEPGAGGGGKCYLAANRIAIPSISIFQLPHHAPPFYVFFLPLSGTITSSDYKWARGFDPELIHSTHYICHPGLRRAVNQFLEYETENNVELREYLTSKSVVKK